MCRAEKPLSIWIVLAERGSKIERKDVAPSQDRDFTPKIHFRVRVSIGIICQSHRPMVMDGDLDVWSLEHRSRVKV